jgi:hypothetical protein
MSMLTAPVDLSALTSTKACVDFSKLVFAPLAGPGHLYVLSRMSASPLWQLYGMPIEWDTDGEGLVEGVVFRALCVAQR